MAGAGIVVVLALVAGFVWFLSGNSDERRNTSGFAPPVTTQASFCDGLAGFQADLSGATSGAAASIAQLRTAADRLRSAGTPENMPDDARASLTAYLAALIALSDTATASDVAGLRTGGTSTQRQQRRALDRYLAAECPATP